jgi:hypothetical protein
MKIALAERKFFVTVSRKRRNDQSGEIAGVWPEPKKPPGSKVGGGPSRKKQNTPKGGTSAKPAKSVSERVER